ncbi:amidase [Nonomuraea sediminis]|uniref:amidase n=1 Tax=Nonomuraea sediminis TaxID=2835864 RepID=UPI00202A101F|nr:amidase family protein [Nonomuraea sediminis]
MHEYARYDAVGIHELIGSGEVTAGEVEAAARQALDQVNPSVNGLTVPVFPAALDHASVGPLAGVPFLIKDHGPVAAGVPFFLGSRAIPGVVPQRDTELMARFRAAGLVTLGLTTVPELCLSFSTESVKHGPTRNPWDLSRGAGGSSGGAAALVAAGAVPVAHASDGSGSIRIPASCCGLVGLKPSRGRITPGPDAGEAMLGMAYEFALTRTVRDTAHLLDAVHGPGIGDRYTAPPPRRDYVSELGTDPGRLRVAVTTKAWSGVAVDDQVAAATLQVARVLEDLGHLVSESSPVVDWDSVMRSQVAEGIAITSKLLLAPRQPDPAKLEAVSRRFVELTREFSALDLLAGLDAQNLLTRSVSAYLTEYDLLVTPTLGQLPATHGTLDYHDPAHTVATWLESLIAYGPFTTLFNASGHPAISLPLGHSAEGLPIGVQFVAPYGREDVLIQIASQLEQAMPWKERTPPVFAGS